MRYIIIFIWSILISSAVSYVLTSMSGDPFSFKIAVFFAGILSVAIFVLGDGILKEAE